LSRPANTSWSIRVGQRQINKAGCQKEERPRSFHTDFRLFQQVLEYVWFAG
jgi:hypothetical protein